MLQVQKLAHSQENVLDLLRKQEIPPSSSVTSLLITSFQYLQGMCERLRDKKEEVCNQKEFQKILQNLELLARQKRNIHTEILLGLSAFQAFVSNHSAQEIQVPAFGLLQEKANHLEVLIKQSLEEVVLEFTGHFDAFGKQLPREITESADFSFLSDEISRLRMIGRKEEKKPHFRKTTDYFYGKIDVSGEVSTIDEILKCPNSKDQGAMSTNTAQRLTEALVSLQDKIKGDGQSIVNQMRISLELVLSGIKTFNQALKSQLQGEFQEFLVLLIQPEEKEAVKREKTESKTMRVAEEEIDGFAHFVGELVVVSDMFDYIGNAMLQSNTSALLTDRFKQTNQTFKELSHHLIDSLLKVRLLPVQGLFKKIPGLARSVADQTGKHVRVELKGSQVKIDKSLYDLLDHPLTHLIRNAVDHGLEMPEQRMAAGKPKTGLIQVEVAHSGDWVVLTIQDDGGGIDVEKIKQKALEKNLLTENQITSLSHQEAMELIFLPGLSTVAQVSEISGRGVGMDVVKRNVEDANGEILITSEKNKGTTFQLKLPGSTSLVIIDGVNTLVGEQEFIFPLETMETAFRPQKKDLFESNHQEMVRFQDQILPILRLHLHFGVETTVNAPEEANLIVVKHKKQKFAVMVDQILGKMQVVAKDLNLEKLMPGQTSQDIAGGAIMGHGGVALILDVDQLNRHLEVPTIDFRGEHEIKPSF